MKCYRVKHLPTGLYFRPSSEVMIKLGDGRTYYVKTNLSKKGKIYTSMPSERWYTEGIYNHVQRQIDLKEVTSQNLLYSSRNKTYPSPKADWLIEEV